MQQKQDQQISAEKRKKQGILGVLCICAGILMVSVFFPLGVMGIGSPTGFIIIAILGIPICGIGIYWKVDSTVDKEKQAQIKDALKKQQEQENKELEDFKNMSPEEQEAYYYKKYVYTDDSKNRRCLGCHKTLIHWENNKRIDEWKLIATKTVKMQEVDSAHTLGGVTTVFYNTKEKTIRTYQCPYCKFERTE